MLFMNKIQIIIEGSSKDKIVIAINFCLSSTAQHNEGHNYWLLGPRDYFRTEN